LLTAITFAQAPQGFNYQATVRNSSGELIINQNVNFKFNVMQNTPTSVPVFSETHFVPTDDLGAVNLVIGKGTGTTGTFSNIDWGNGIYYLGIELNTGNGYVAMGTTQLLSVPYALYAQNSGNTQTITPNLAAVLAVENSANNTKIVNLADPTNPQDAASKAYVDTNSKTFFNFSGFDNYQVWQDNSTINLVPNSFNFINANNTTLVFPSKPEKCCFGDVIYLYMMQNGENNRRSVTLKPNGFPVAFSQPDNSLKWSNSSTTQFIGTFSSGLNAIINVGDYWMCGTFTYLSTLTTPTLTTTAASAITITTASSGGSISSDGGATVTARGIAWSTNNNPTIDLSTKTVDGSGTGIFTSDISGLAAGTTYYVRAYATNSFGTSYGNQIIFNSSVTDVDGNVYGAVKIGNQVWTKENLNVSKYRNGDIIPQVTNQTEWSNLTTGAWCYYENSTANGTTYGKLYNWYAVNDPRGLAPQGWHVSSNDEWTVLTTFLGGKALREAKLKKRVIAIGQCLIRTLLIVLVSLLFLEVVA
jgi:hypothetical protein